MKQAKKDLQKISKQLKGSAKMHASQAKNLTSLPVNIWIKNNGR
jgi:conjugal transfer/entry exclusion protein